MGPKSMRLRRLWLALPNDGGEGGGGEGGDGAGTGGGAGAGGSDNGVGKGGEGGDGKSTGDDDQFKTLDGKKATLADLSSERDRRQQAEKELQELRDANKSKEQRDTEAREKQDEQARKDARENQQFRAAAAAGLSLADAKRITGDTPEEMLADAKEYAARLAQAGKRDDSGDHTHGAGTSGDGGAADSNDGMTTLGNYFASSSSKK